MQYSNMLVLIIQVIAIVLAIISQQHVASASLVVPVTKHTDAALSPLYSAHAYFDKAQYQDPYVPSTPAYWNQWRYVQQSLLIDLDAPFSWHFSYPRQEGCQECRQPVKCTESPCTDLRTTSSYQSPLCPPPTNTSMYDTFLDCETCPVNVVSPVTGECSQVIPTYDQFMFTNSNGRGVMSYDPYITYPIAGSSAPWTFDPFPKPILGVMGLSTSPYALPAYLGEVDRVIALCLPSNVSRQGVLFFGYGPYYLSPQIDVDVRSLLSYTALLKHPKSFGYFIGVNSIAIKNRSIKLPVNATTKISTLEPYTKLRTDIYNNVVRRFSKVTKRIPPAKSVAPFGLCFNMTVNGTTVGIKVPNIDLVLQDGKKWTISTANSIKQVTEDVACLAVIDGGPTSEHAIVVGTYQFEDNMLVFDLMTSTFGFSSSLLRNNTACSNFSFEVSH